MQGGHRGSVPVAALRRCRHGVRRPTAASLFHVQPSREVQVEFRFWFCLSAAGVQAAAVLMA
jgi:hypothetical protein